MVNKEHLEILEKGVEEWNRWREKTNDIQPDLSEIDLSNRNFIDANFRKTSFRDTNFELSDLSRANFRWSNLHNADLSKSKIVGSDLTGTNLYKTNFNEADIHESDLSQARMVETKLNGTNLANCRVYGISAWGLELHGADQSNLVITRRGEPEITLDNLEVAQFIYLLLKNEKIRGVIDTITSKAVLILGRFTPDRKAVLDAIKDELRTRDYLPIIFDWERPASRNLIETVSTLAHMSRFIIADITDAKSIPAELQSIVPQLPSVPIQPIMLRSDCEYGLFDHISSFNSVLNVYLYETQEMLLANLKDCVVGPAETKAKELKRPTVVK